MSVDSFERWFFAHTVVIPIVLLTLGIALRYLPVRLGARRPQTEPARIVHSV